MTRPELPTCEECEQVFYDPRTWKVVARSGRREKSDPPPPCGQCPKIFPGEPATPEQGKASQLSEKNWECYLHYLKCKAIGRFPEDEIVENHAGLVRMIEDHVDRQAGIEPMAMVLGTILKTQAKAARR